MSATKRQLGTLADTKALAEELAPRLRLGDVLTLSGDLGAGKTTFAQFLVKALGSNAEVTSPTFTLLQTYPIAIGELWHYDLYRIEHESALVELGFEDARGKLTIIEWPERMGSARPAATLALSFRLAEDGSRSVEIA